MRALEVKASVARAFLTGMVSTQGTGTSLISSHPLFPHLSAPDLPRCSAHRGEQDRPLQQKSLRHRSLIEQVLSIYCVRWGNSSEQNSRGLFTLGLGEGQNNQNMYSSGAGIRTKI